MEFVTHKLIDEDTCEKINRLILNDQKSWIDGKKTAGSHAAVNKNNRQLLRSSKASVEQSELLLEKMYSDPLIKSFSLPRHIHGLMFSKTSSGEGYGMHVDNAFMSSGRSDLSFTIFLSDPQSYKGGQLVIQSVQDIKKFKLNQGQIIIYPSSSLHAVEEVTCGERIACVGWIESYIRSNEDRSLLFNLEAGAKGLLSMHGRSSELDLIFQVYANLLRRLGA